MTLPFVSGLYYSYHLNLQPYMDLHQPTRYPDNHQREQQRAAQARHSCTQEIRIMEADEALYGIPSVRDDVASQGDRSGRLDEREPSGLVLHVGEEIEKAHHKERDGIAYEEPGRSGLNLRDNPIRMDRKSVV